MRCLLDTQTFLWWLATPAKVNHEVSEIIENPQHELFFSAVSSWEISIKYAIGKLNLPRLPEVYISNGIKQGGFSSINVEHAHAYRVAHLPHHHNDPFDRLLICQAQIDGLTVLTSDPAFEMYEVDVVRSD